jgi:hypothetical protein
MRSPQLFRHRSIATLAGGLLVLAACGGGGQADDSGAADGVDIAPTAAADGDELTTSGVDLGGPDVAPASEIATNLFPDLVVDDVGRGKKVNIRNIVPADKPVLLWMWAPH